MGPLALLNHALNFLAPALWLALLVPLIVKLFFKKRSVAHSLPRQVAIHFVVNVIVLGLGLVLFSQDGRMLTYLTLVVATAGSQWWMVKGWRV